MTKGQRTYMRKNHLINKWCWENQTATCKKRKRKKLDQARLKPYTKFSQKWIENLSVRRETMKLLEKNIGST